MEQTPRSKATRNGSSVWLAAVALTLGMAGLAWAGDSFEVGRADGTAAAQQSPAPWSRASMDPTTRSKLTSAFALAAARIEGSPECAALFAELGADGAELLATSLYFPAPPAQRASTCRQAAAYTYVGSAPTFLCGGFTSLTDEHAALVLVHEALHHAGLPESPSDPRAMSSAAINEMVRKACGFEVFKRGGRAR
jgi:hypothetical protein